MTALQSIITSHPGIDGIGRGGHQRITNQMELFQRGIVVAIASSAGFSYSIPQLDDGIDIEINDPISNTADIPASIAIQLKSTCTGFDTNDCLHSRMTVKRYDEFRYYRYVQPRIVVIMDLPRNQDDWYKIQADGSSLVRNSCYWTSLVGAPKISGTQKYVNVKARKDHPFDDATLCMLMAKTRRGFEL